MGQNETDAPACRACSSIAKPEGLWLRCLDCGEKQPNDWTPGPLATALHMGARRNAWAEKLAGIFEAVEAARAACVPEVEIRARLEGLAEASRRDEQRWKLAGGR